MKVLILICLFGVYWHTYSQNTENELYIVTSNHDFVTTLDRLYNTLNENKLTIFADFNHQQNAHDVGLTMPQSRVIVFGNPIVGTLLMFENPEIALDLPLKIAVIQDQNSTVKLIFTKTSVFANKYGIKNTSILDKMQHLLENIVQSTK